MIRFIALTYTVDASNAIRVTISTALDTADAVYAEPDACFMIDGKLIDPGNVLDCVMRILTVWPGFMLVGLI